MEKILITGSTGYIGSQLVEKLQEDKLLIIEASRNKATDQNEWLFFDLYDYESFKIPDEVSAIVHLAISPSHSEKNPIDFCAVAHLMKEADRVDAKFIFISTQVARENAPTLYGYNKWKIEESIKTNQNAYVVRPGFVYGCKEEGLYGVMTRIIRKTAVLPALIPEPLIQPVHVKKLCGYLSYLCTSEYESERVISIGSRVPIKLSDFIRQINRQTSNKKIIFIPVPTLLIRIILLLIGQKIANAIGIGRIKSLIDLPQMDVTWDA